MKNKSDKSRINLLEIGKIKTKEQLKKYHINTSLLNGNYLFHYLIITDNMTGLKLYNHPIYRFNSDGLDGLMLAAREKKYNILDFFIKKYKEYLYIKNKKNQNFLHYMDVDDMEYLEIILNNKIKWLDLFTVYSANHQSPLDILFLKGKFNVIIKIIDHIKFDYSKYLTQPFIFNLTLNNKLNAKNIIDILDFIYKQDSNIFNYVDEMGYTIAFPIILKDDHTLIQYIVDMVGTKLNRYSPITAKHLFIISYKLALKKDNYDNPMYILKHTMKDIDFNETDHEGNNMAHFILRSRMVSRKGNYEIEKYILDKYDDWNRLNIHKKSPLDYIVNLDYNMYHKFVTNRPSNINKNMDKKWYKYIKKLKIKDNDIDVNLIASPYSHSNMFQARFTDMGIFGMYLSEKYKSLYFPQYSGTDVTPDWNDDIVLPDELLRTYNNFPWIIIWNNENNYWIHPHLNKLMNDNMNKYKIGIVFLSMRLPDGGLHAGLILYDFTKNTIERFDPYGNTIALDGKMDELFQEKLTKNTNMTYCSPECYFPVSGFQTLSDENNIMNEKLGDFGGYCLAWSLWYIEHKINNLNVDSKDLVRKTINRFMNLNIRPMEYIRNYANHISIYRLEYLKRIGVPYNITSNENLPFNYVNLVNRILINNAKGKQIKLIN